MADRLNVGPSNRFIKWIDIIVARYMNQRFGEAGCLHLQNEDQEILLKPTLTCLANYIASYPTRVYFCESLKSDRHMDCTL